MLFPSFGPLIDHPFAEREPDNRHNYPGQVVPDHVHPYQAHHTHSLTHGPSNIFPTSSTSDAYESLREQYLPYANISYALTRLGLPEMAVPSQGYGNYCQLYGEIARRIREAQTTDELRAYMLEGAQIGNLPDQMATAEPR